MPLPCYILHNPITQEAAEAKKKKQEDNVPLLDLRPLLSHLWLFVCKCHFCIKGNLLLLPLGLKSLGFLPTALRLLLPLCLLKLRVMLLTSGRVCQGFISRNHSDKLTSGNGIALVDIGVELEGELPITLLYLLQGGFRCQAESFIAVLWGCGRHGG